jgi:hypothetical protein
VTLGQLTGKLAMLEICCTRGDRRGRLNVARLIAEARRRCRPAEPSGNSRERLPARRRNVDPSIAPFVVQISSLRSTSRCLDRCSRTSSPLSPVAGPARASMNLRSGQMRQTTMAEVCLDHGKAAGSSPASRVPRHFGCPGSGANEFRCRSASVRRKITLKRPGIGEMSGYSACQRGHGIILVTGTRVGGWPCVVGD